MIQANELRIGNWIWLVYAPYGSEQSREYKVVDIEEIKRAAGVLSVNSFYQEPVPLTPELLEQCGFKNTSFDRFEKDSCVLITVSDGVIFGLANELTVLAVIKYLHQLQNLYFALTGTELPLNLTETTTSKSS